MEWQEIEVELKERSLPKGKDADAFWAEFRERTADVPRDVSVPEPVPFRRWVMLAAAAAAILAAVAVLRPVPETPTMQVASTEVKSVDVVASHGGVIIMKAEADGTDDADDGGMILWIADLDLDLDFDESEGK